MRSSHKVKKNETMLEKFKLKHLDLISEENIDYAKFMIALFGYKNSRWNKVKAFVSCYRKTYDLIEKIKQIDPKKVGLNKDCPIKFYENIDSISFSAMMQVQMLSNNSEDKKIGELISELIAVTCYERNHNKDFDIESLSFKHFQNRILESPAFDMIGLYNHLDKQLKDSANMWERLFFEVEVIDQDYMEAGGSALDKFNVINTIKMICNDFNLTYKEAWQMPYGVTQTNSLAKATSTFVQEKMSKIKERKMRIQRGQ